MTQTARDTRSRVILCADDYGLSAGVSDAILELAAEQRLSATSAIVTLERWPQDAQRLLSVRDRIATGLHLNLTLGAPLGPMPNLAPDGRLPPLRRLLALSLARRLEPEEIAAEVMRQVERFETGLGFPPDHVDGHQHVHAFPLIRAAVLAALAARFPDRAKAPLLRDPSDALRRIRQRGMVPRKAMLLSLLGARFGRAARGRGFVTNTSFAGVSSFDRRVPYETELAAAFKGAGPLHMIMCHPGHADDALASLDPVVGRREDEYEAIARYEGLPSRLWRPVRAMDGPPVAWKQDQDDG